MPDPAPESKLKSKLLTDLASGRVWTYLLGDGEVWECYDTFRSEADAIAAGLEAARDEEDDDGPHGSYQTGRMSLIRAGTFDPDYITTMIVDHLGERAFDLAGEAAEGWPDPDQASLRIAEAHIAAALHALVSGSRALVHIAQIKTHTVTD